MNQHSFRQKQGKNWKFVLTSANILPHKIFLTIKYNPLSLKWGLKELSSMFGSPETSISNWDIFWQDFGQNCIKKCWSKQKICELDWKILHF